MCTHMCVHVCVNEYGGQRLLLDIFLSCFLLCILRQGLSREPRAHQFSRSSLPTFSRNLCLLNVGIKSVSVCLSVFYVGDGDPNSSLHLKGKYYTL